jgi:predicted O-linked N-acetylglucosamine transferase (SPINDLY family)
LDEAEKIYRETLSQHPAHADALYLLGTIYLQRGSWSSAQLFLRKAIAACPDHLEAMNNLGLTLDHLGRKAEAIQAFDRVIEQSPQHADAYYNRGNIHREKGDLLQAEADYRSALAYRPAWAQAIDNLGITLRLQDRLEEARQVSLEAMKLSRTLVGPMLNLGAIAKSQGDLRQAEEWFSLAVKSFPTHAAAHTNLGIVQAHLKNWASAELHTQRAVELDPGSAIAQNNLGLVLFLLGRESEAVHAFHAAVTIDPAFADAFNNLGSALYRLGQLVDSANAYRRSLELKESVTAWKNLGSILDQSCCWDESIESFHQASQLKKCRLHKNDPILELRALLVCPTVFDSLDSMDEHRVRLEEELANWADREIVRPAEEWLDADIRPSFSWQFQGKDDRRVRELLARIVEPSLCSEGPTAKRTGLPTAGFVVAPGHEYAFVRSIGGMFRLFDRRHWRPCILGAPSSETKLRRDLGESLDFVRLPGDLEGMVRAIRSAQIDLLYHWEIGTSAVNYLLPFCRATPMQVTSWGIQVTSGIAAIDYYLSSRCIEPEDAERVYTEKLIRLETMLSYQRPMLLPEVPLTRSSLGLPEEGHLYLCAQQLGKFHPAFDEILATILREDPAGYLVVTRSEFEPENDRLRRRWERTLAGLGDRVVWISKQVGPAYASLMLAADVVLDPIHFGGVNTTYDALSAGRVSVTWPSGLHRGRYTLGCFRRMEMLDTVASSAEEYIAISLRVARDADYRRHLEGEIANRRRILFECRESALELERTLLNLIDSC